MVLSRQSPKPFLAILGAAWSPYGIISHLIGAADVALMLVAGKEEMIMATTPEQEAEYALDYETGRSEPSLGQVDIDLEQLAAKGNGGPREPWGPLTTEERSQARRERRDERVRGRKKRRELAAATIWLPMLGVAVRDGNVYAWELSWSGPVTGRLLGPLAWAHAEATGGVAARPGTGNAQAADSAPAVGRAGLLGLLARVSNKGHRGVAAVAFPDGNVWKKEFTGASALIKVKAEAVRFNIMAVGAAPETRPAGDGVASDLERLAALHASGVLDDEEFRQAKTLALSGGR